MINIKFSRALKSKGFELASLKDFEKDQFNCRFQLKDFQYNQVEALHDNIKYLDKIPSYLNVRKYYIIVVNNKPNQVKFWGYSK